MNKKIIKKIISPIVGKKILQSFFEGLYSFSLLGMNIGSEGDPNKSGEKYAADYVENKLKQFDNVTVFDVGANVGNYSLLLKKVFGNKAKIYSFEPSKKTFEKLQANIGSADGINLYNFGFGDEIAKVNLFSDSNESGLASIYKRNLTHFKIDMNRREEITIRTLDSFCKDNNIGRIHFLKLDVEGHEKKVLDGAQDMLKKGAIDFIQFEFGGCNIDSKTYFQDFYYLLKSNYKVSRILKDGLRQINEYKEEYDQFFGRNHKIG
jgi:FkbM family methyltransferase